MAKWSWIDRTFTLDFPPSKFPDLLERVRGTPARIEDRVSGLEADKLTRRDGRGWSIQENIGHLCDLECLHMRRIEQILAGEQTLVAADMTNKKTEEANHNARDIASLLADFRTVRAEYVAQFERVKEEDWNKSALHARTKLRMRIVDIAYFTSEHDDYHLARIGELIKTFTAG